VVLWLLTLAVSIPLAVAAVECGVAIVLLLFMAEFIAGELPQTGIVYLSYTPDPIFLILLASASLRILVGHGLNRVVAPVLGLAALILASFASGLTSYGLNASGAELRPFAHFVIGALYVATFQLSPGSRARLQWICAAPALLMLPPIWWRWSQVMTGTASGAWMEYATTPMRVAQAKDALVILQGTVLLATARVQRALVGVAAGLAVVTLVFLQHRTIWAILAVFFLAGLVITKTRKHGLVVSIAVVIGSVAFVNLPYADSSLISATLRDSVSTAFDSRSGTLAWRVEGWKALYTEENSPDLYTVFLGRPFGSGYVRQVAHRTTDVSPHSFYVQAALRVGLLGTLVLIGLYCQAWRQLAEVGDLTVPLRAILLSQLAFFITYAPNFEQGVYLGVVVAIAAMSGRSATASRNQRLTCC